MMRLGRFGMRMFGVMTALLMLAMPLAAEAQAGACTAPQVLPPSHAVGPSARDPRRLLPVAGYTLALSWSPEYCHRRRDSVDDAFQCGGGNRFGFTLHGLWPDGQGHEWPQYCRAVGVVPEAVVRQNLCAIPSAQLVQHEWAKHGSCVERDPARYFERAARLYRGLAFPDMAALSRRTLTGRAIQTAFARANSGMRPEMVRVDANRRGWLEGLWLCLDTGYRPRACPAEQGGASPEALVKIWRGGGGAGYQRAADRDGGDRTRWAGRGGRDRGESYR